MLTLGSLAFISPWILLGLAGLPLLWLFLRVTPPSPTTVVFAPIRLLYALKPKAETPDTTPWWLILLRLLFAALLILGLSHPVVRDEVQLAGSGPLVLVIDDGWAAGRDWPARIAKAERLLDHAEQSGRTVLIVTTAMRSNEGSHVSQPLPASEARRALRALQPKPWPVDRAAALEAIQQAEIAQPAEAFWLSDGLRAPADDDLTQQLQRLGGLTLVRDQAGSVKRLFPPRNTGRELEIDIERALSGEREMIWIRVSGADGREIARIDAVFADGAREAQAILSLPVELRNQVTRIDIEGETTAGAVVLLDDRFARRLVGLVSETAFDAAQPLLDELFYLERALDPFSEVRRGKLDAFMRDGTSAILLADTGEVPFEKIQQINAWIESGGVFVRFAGPRLAAASLASGKGGLGPKDLVPVRLRRGDRALGGALTWGKPTRFEAFRRDGPFEGLGVAEDVLIRRQVLAEPSIELSDRSWARLSDGTPIVTAEARGEGWLILFHTTANTEWSNLAISGQFVDMLRRIVQLGSGGTARGDAGPMAPVEILDGFGRLAPPPATARAFDASKDATSQIGPALPPGFYGTELTRVAVNLSPGIESLRALTSPPAGVTQSDYALTDQFDMKPWLILAALLLFLIDLVATLWLRGLLLSGMANRAVAGAVAALLLLSSAGVATAQDREPETFALESSLETRLAFVRTGDAEIDAVSAAGLMGLSEILSRRTAIEPSEPMAVDPARDELAFFAMLYWPIAESQPMLSAAAIEKLNAYMRNGGTLFIDTRDQFEQGFGGTIARGLKRLRQVSRGLDIPALEPVPAGHVLGRAFYLLTEYPGRFAGGLLWIAGPEEKSENEVTPIIIGSHDWAGAWAQAVDGSYLYPVVPGGELQREMAFRFGVNLMMYALTGNYKADQVHVPSILQRVGQ